MMAMCSKLLTLASRKLLESVQAAGAAALPAQASQGEAGQGNQSG